MTAPSEFLDPRKFGLPGRKVLISLGPNHVGLIIDRKSRIVMSDGFRLLKDVNRIQNTSPETRVSLVTSTPVCSKTRHFLKEHQVEITPLLLRHHTE